MTDPSKVWIHAGKLKDGGRPEYAGSREPALVCAMPEQWSIWMQDTGIFVTRREGIWPKTIFGEKEGRCEARYILPC
jgi:hypothetical protein